MPFKRLAGIWRFAGRLLPALCACFCFGCETSADKLSRHFDAIADITMQNAAHCDILAQKLDAYLDEHGAEMKRARHRLMMAHAEDLRGIFQSTTRIDMVTEHCAPPVLKRFRYRMAEILFEEPQ